RDVEQAREEDEGLVRRATFRGLDAEVVHELFVVVHAEHRVRIANVDDEEHGASASEAERQAPLDERDERAGAGGRLRGDTHGDRGARLHFGRGDRLGGRRLGRGRGGRRRRRLRRGGRGRGRRRHGGCRFGRGGRRRGGRGRGGRRRLRRGGCGLRCGRCDRPCGGCD